MKKQTKGGFVLIFVVVAIALIAVATFVMTDDAKTMLFHSDTAYLEAIQRNLVVSGLHWAKHNLRDEPSEVFGRTTELDVTRLSVRPASLTITMDTPAEQAVQVRIDASCSRARRTLRHDGTYLINSK
jgi:type II secretory pathway component PulK